MLIILFLFILLVNYLQSIFTGINYYDEVVTIVGVVLIGLFRSERFGLAKDYMNMLICILVVLIVGTISTIRFHIQPQFAGVWRDALAIIKFPVCYYAYSLYACHIDLERLNKEVAPIARVFIGICVTLGIITYLLRGPLEGILYHGERYGFPLYDMGFSHNTFLIAVVIICMAVLIADGFTKNRLFILFGIICLCFTLRSKPMMAMVFLAFIWYVRREGAFFWFTKRTIYFHCVMVAVFTFFVAASQIKAYVGYGESAARGACYFYGIDIANKFFPFGSGFCTFSSNLSGNYYSPLYYEYGLSKIQGLSPYDYSYASDTFWPCIYSQYGWIGLAFYFLMLFFIIRSAHRRFLPLSDQWVSAMFLLLYSVSSAFAEAFFTNSTAVDYALVLTLFIGKNHENITDNTVAFFRRRRKIYS